MISFAKEDKKSCYEGIALSDTYSNEYYSQVRDCHSPPTDFDKNKNKRVNVGKHTETYQIIESLFDLSAVEM